MDLTRHNTKFGRHPFYQRLNQVLDTHAFDASGDGPHQLRVRYLAEVVRQVGVHHLPVARPVRILLRWQDLSISRFITCLPTRSSLFSWGRMAVANPRCSMHSKGGSRWISSLG